MKRILFAMVALTLVMSIVLAGAALASPKKEGVIKAVDEKAGTVTILFEGDKEPSTIILDKKHLSTLEAGQDARVYFDDDACTVPTRIKALKPAIPPIGC